MTTGVEDEEPLGHADGAAVVAADTELSANANLQTIQWDGYLGFRDPRSEDAFNL